MDYRVLMELASELGTRLAVAGAETYRIEESIVRVLAAYGLDSRVYSVPNSLFITIMVPGELPITQLCRMKNVGTDLDAVEKGIVREDGIIGGRLKKQHLLEAAQMRALDKKYWRD